jgi:CRP-like cAMP-binding protein
MLSPDKIEILGAKMKEEFRFFGSLGHDELNAFLSFCENRQFDAGQNLWTEGDEDNFAAFIVSGKVGIKKRTEFEGKYMIVGTFAKGTVVGELCLLTKQTRSVTSIVLEDTDVVRLATEDFEKLMTEYPMLGLKLLRHIFLVISKRLSRSTERMASIF